MEPVADVRVFCIGKCGTFVYIAFPVAVTFLTTEGEYAECVKHGYYCQECRNWFEWVTETLLLGGGDAN